MRIAYAGGRRVGEEILEWLLANGYDVPLVTASQDRFEFNYPRIYGRIREKVIAHAALDAKIERGEIDEDWIVLTINSRNLFSKAAVDRAKIINLHLGLIEEYRGFHCLAHPMIEGKTHVGYTFHIISSKIDVGEIVFDNRIPILPTDTGETLYDRVMSLATDDFKQKFPEYLRTGCTRRMERLGVYKKYDALLEKEVKFSGKTGLEIFNFVRAQIFTGFPGAYVLVDGRKYEFSSHKANEYPELEIALGDACGEQVYDFIQKHIVDRALFIQIGESRYFLVPSS